MQKRQIPRNAIASVLQILVNSVVLFVLYRFLLRTIGVEHLGIWALILATTSITRLGELGLSASVVKFVAKYATRGEEGKVSGIIQTAVISVGLSIGLFLLIIYVFAKWILAFIVPPESLAIAISILPYALLSFWVASIAGIFQSGLDGYQRVDLRAIILTGATVLNLFICMLLAPIYGITGLAYAQLIQSCVVAFLSWFLLKRHIENLPYVLYRWDQGLFREILGYGLNFQIITVAGMLCDPVTKGLLSKFGGLSMVGYYEMANRMIVQFRTLIIAANQSLVPAVASLYEENMERVKDIYLNSYDLIFLLSVPSFALIISMAPVISEIWIGHYEPVFIVFSILLGIGFLLNTFNIPAYFINLGTGDLFWNTVSVVTMGLLNAGLGLLLGLMYNGTGVVIGWVFSMVLAGLIVVISYHIKNKISFGELLPKQNIPLVFASILGLATLIGLYHYFKSLNSFIILGGVSFVIFSIIVAVPVWRHPMRVKITGMLKHELLRMS